MTCFFNKIGLYLLVALCSLLGMVPSCHSATNLALGKIYTLSQKPNYQFSAAATDTTSLTDGVSTTGYFWTQKTTVGWYGHKYIEILIDLEKDATVSGIRFSTAQGSAADVHLPNSISVFIGPDNNHLQYSGDIATTAVFPPVKYEQRTMELNNIDAKGRYVFLVAEVEGPYLFCDEIQVLAGNKDNGKTGSLNIATARQFATQNSRLVKEKRMLVNMLDASEHTIIPSSNLTARFLDTSKKIDELFALNKSDEIKNDVFGLRGEALSKLFPGQHLLLEAVHPWKKLTQTSRPSGEVPSEIQMFMLRGGYAYSALMLTNITKDKMHLSVSIVNLLPGSPDVKLDEAVFVKTVSVESVPDALVPLSGQLTIMPGESKIVFLTVRGNKPGIWRGNLVLSGSDKKISISITMKVLSQNLPVRQSLNSVNWGYLSFPLIKSRIPAAVKDLADHHTNIIVVPSAQLNLPSFDITSNFDKLKQYLKLHKKADKLLLYMDGTLKKPPRNGKAGVLFDDSWKDRFKLWYHKLLTACSEAGYSKEQVYLYPYDEMNGDEINQFIALASWAKTEIPGIRFFATMNNKDAFRALPHLEIAQIINSDDLLSKLIKTNAELWLYGASEKSKSLSPYSYYRLMSWKAYYYGYKGIGFWAYADAGWDNNPPSTAWDDFDGKYPDYAVIYEGENNTIISSRRWEAWRMGIEDYELLTMYASKNGNAAAKALAKDVIDHPQDTARADKVRRRILEEL